MYIHRDGEYEPITRIPPSFTNADRISSMDDNELADELYTWHLATFCRSREWIVNWLKEKEEKE